MEWFNAFIVVFASGMRLAVPLILACLADCGRSDRASSTSGLRADPRRRLRLGCGATFTGSVWMGLAVGLASNGRLLFDPRLRFDRPARQSDRLGNCDQTWWRTVSLRSIGNAIWSQGGRTPQLPASAQSGRSNFPLRAEIGAVPIIGPISIEHLISGYDLITYTCLPLGATHLLGRFYSTRFGSETAGGWRDIPPQSTLRESRSERSATAR